MGLIKIECSICRKGIWIDQDRYDKHKNICCSRKKCKQARHHISRDGTQEVKQW